MNAAQYLTILFELVKNGKPYCFYFHRVYQEFMNIRINQPHCQSDWFIQCKLEGKHNIKPRCKADNI
jgi:hypothetical protein